MRRQDEVASLRASISSYCPCRVRHTNKRHFVGVIAYLGERLAHVAVGLGEPQRLVGPREVLRGGAL
eukprot:6934433-Pyramimonas_sp.AAC.1